MDNEINMNLEKLKREFFEKINGCEWDKLKKFCIIVENAFGMPIDFDDRVIEIIQKMENGHDLPPITESEHLEGTIGKNDNSGVSNGQGGFISKSDMEAYGINPSDFAAKELYEDAVIEEFNESEYGRYTSFVTTERNRVLEKIFTIISYRCQDFGTLKSLYKAFEEINHEYTEDHTHNFNGIEDHPYNESLKRCDLEEIIPGQSFNFEYLSEDGSIKSENVEFDFGKKR